MLLIIFAAVALMLAAVGIYGYWLTPQLNAGGDRRPPCPGAKPTDIFKLVLVQALRLVIVGLILGLVLSFISTRVMSTLLFGVSVTDPDFHSYFIAPACRRAS